MGRTLFGSQLGILRHTTKRWLNIHSVQGPTAQDMYGVRTDLYGHLVRENVRRAQEHPIPLINNADVKSKRSALFSEEQKKQLSVGRIEKITIECQLPIGESTSFLMNKYISTPHHCALHLGEPHISNSVVAEVNGQVWDMHRPLLDNCSLRFLTMRPKDEDPFHVNRIFWRSCSVMLGCVLERAFQDHFYIELHSFPSANVRSGSFVYDVDIKIPNWKPNSDEMRVFSAEMIKLAREKLPFERLEVSTELALEMFEENKYKREQIPEIAQTSHDGKSVCLYRIGDFVEISRGPLISNTGLLGKTTVTSLHSLQDVQNISPTLYRIQGVALPAGFHLNHFAYHLIEEREKKMNPARLPGALRSESDSYGGYIDADDSIGSSKQASRVN